jgi:hypothetical protein
MIGVNAQSPSAGLSAPDKTAQYCEVRYRRCCQSMLILPPDILANYRRGIEKGDWGGAGVEYADVFPWAIRFNRCRGVRRPPREALP